MNSLVLTVGWVLIGFVGLLGLKIVWAVWTGEISLKLLIADESGDASMSRFQFLIFTFVIALSLFLVIVGDSTAPKFPPEIPAGILTLLGISGTSFLVSKGINAANPALITTPTLVVTPSTATLAAGAKATFTVAQTNVPDNSPMPAVVWSLDAPAVGTLSSSGNSATYTAPESLPKGETKVTVRVTAAGFTPGTATLTLG